ncbi:MAG: TonB-dependent receptor [Bacteroidetes bacterium]|nr:TonB-dependent receptor [Bacteroidota bacterium]
MFSFRIAMLFIAFVFFIPATLFAEQKFSVSGTVRSTEGPTLPNATIFVHELNIGTTTDSEGYFEFLKIKPGSYHVHVYYTGYETAVKTFKVEDKPERLEIFLKPTSLELKAFVLEESILNIDNDERSIAVDVIDKNFIEKNASSSFAKTLEKLPGINSINLGTGISKPVIRGMSFNRIVVAENGIKQEGQQWGADHGLEIDQYNIERVEIIKGPASLIYGSDAMGGVVNIRPPVFPVDGTFASSVNLFGATNNDLLGTSLMAAGNKKGKIFRFRLTHQNYGDYKVPAESFNYNGYILPIVNGRLKNTAGNENNFTTAIGLNKNWGYSTVTLSVFEQHAGLFAGAHGTPRAYQLQHDGDYRDIGLPSQKTRHVKVMSNTNVLFKKNWLAIDLGYQNNNREELSLPHSHGVARVVESNLEHGLRLQTYTANIRYNIQNSERSSRTYGASGNFQEHKRDGFQFLLPDYTSGNMAAFVFQKYKAGEKLHLNAGIRYDQTFIHIYPYMEPVYESSGSSHYVQKNSEQEKAFGNVSGGLGLSWLMNDALNFKANLGSSFRTPAPYELSANGIHHGAFRHEMGDSSLSSERGYQLDLGLHFHKKEFLASFTPFVNYFNDYIFLSPSGRFSPLPEAGQLYRFMQTDALLAGAEFKSDYHISQALHIGFAGEYVFSMDLLNHYPLPFTPPFSGELEIEYELDKIGNKLSKTFLNFSVKATSAQNFTGRNEPSTPGYFLMNINSGTAVKVKEYQFQVVFSVHNLANNPYFAHLSRYRVLNLPEPGRNFRISLFLPLTNYKSK